MKALLLKDWYVLRKQVWSYLLIVLVWGLIPSLTLNLLAVVYGAMIPYTAMAYDQRSRWDSFARMLPYSDRTVVLSRYTLGWISIAVGGVVMLMLQSVLSLFFPRFDCPLWLPLTALCVGLVLLDINIPLMLRFGTEKARWITFLMTFLICASVGALSGLASDPQPAGAGLLSLALPGLLALTIIATAVSILLSLKFYRENR